MKLEERQVELGLKPYINFHQKTKFFEPTSERDLKSRTHQPDLRTHLNFQSLFCYIQLPGQRLMAVYFN